MNEQRQGGTEARSLRIWSERVIGASIEVHKHLGPGLLESAYQAALAHEFRLRAIPFRQQVQVPASYKGISLELGYRIDFIVAEEVIVEIKAVEQVLAVHGAQLITYLHATGIPVGLLINFQADALRSGIRRYVLDPKFSVPPCLPASRGRQDR